MIISPVTIKLVDLKNWQIRCFFVAASPHDLKYAMDPYHNNPIVIRINKAFWKKGSANQICFTWRHKRLNLSCIRLREYIRTQSLWGYATMHLFILYTNLHAGTLDDWKWHKLRKKSPRIFPHFPRQENQLRFICVTCTVNVLILPVHWFFSLKSYSGDLIFYLL